MKTYKALFIAAAAMLSAACTEKSEAERQPQGISVTVNAEITSDETSTRTYIENEEKGTVNWNAEGETLKVIESYDAASAEHQAVNTEGYVLDGRKASFSMTISPAEGKDNYYYTAIYPATAYNPAGNSTAGNLRLSLPAEQTPTADSFDQNADLMRSQAVSARLAENPVLSLNFTRIVSINKMTLKGLTAGEKVATVTMEASKALAGNCVTNLTGSYVKTSTAAEKVLTLNMSGQAVAESGEMDCWFTSYPASFGEGDNMTVTVVTTDGCTYTKDIKFTAEKTLEFKGGEGSRFAVNGWTKTLETVDFTTIDSRESLLIPESAGQTSDEINITVGGHEYVISGRKISDANQITYYSHENTTAKLYSLYFTRKGSVSADYQYGLIQLPTIAGYAPTSLSIISYASGSKSYKVCDLARTVPADENVAGTLTVAGNTGTAQTMELSGTSADKDYYLWIPLWAQFRKLSVTYKQM